MTRAPRVADIRWSWALQAKSSARGDLPDHAISTAAQLDRLADIELSHGHPRAAERLAHRAAELREAAR